MSSDNKKEAVVIVTPYSTGCCIAQEILKRGYTVICLWSKGFSEEMKLHVPQSCADLSYDAEITEEESLEETAELAKRVAKDRKIIACICGGEAGVDLTDALSELLGLRTNGTNIPQRRDKKFQQELIKAAGLRSVRQAGGAKFSDVELFLRKEEYPVIVKPVDSAGSDGVKLCHNFTEAKKHFHSLMKSKMVNGGTCEAVLCQEFLKGKEYVVDHVSMDGVHKTVMLWKYDKRPANGAMFVYFGCLPLDSGSPEAQAMVPYVRGVLDALGVQNGPSHGEIIMTADGPCLVEMNARAHGGDGNWQTLCRALTGGYTQVDAAVDAYLDENKFRRLPDMPPSPFKASGQEVDLVSFSKGKVKATPGFVRIKQLPSVVYFETHIKAGSQVTYTVDLVTDIANVILMHQDEEVMKNDVKIIRRLENDDALFEYEEEEKEMSNDGDFEYEFERQKMQKTLCALDLLSLPTIDESNHAGRHRKIISCPDPPEMYYW